MSPRMHQRQKAAHDAIDALFNDTDLSSTAVAQMLEELIADIESKLESIDEGCLSRDELFDHVDHTSEYDDED